MSQEIYHAVVRALPHRLRVMRMYRYGLRELNNYSVTREEWIPRAEALRLEFEMHKEETNRERIYQLVQHGENLLSRFRHWEPIIRPEMPGGTAYSISPSQPKWKFVLDWDKLDPYKRGDWM